MWQESDEREMEGDEVGLWWAGRSAGGEDAQAHQHLQVLKTRGQDADDIYETSGLDHTAYSRGPRAPPAAPGRGPG